MVKMLRVEQLSAIFFGWIFMQLCTPTPCRAAVSVAVTQATTQELSFF